jgi:nitrogen regulatory protein P-II 1
MPFLVVLVLDDPNQSDLLLDAWEQAGASGITILDSSGIGRVRRASLRDDMPLLPSLRHILRGGEEHHRTFFSLAEDEAQVQALVSAAQQVMGDLDQPHTGLLFVTPVAQVYGLHKQDATRKATKSA